MNANDGQMVGRNKAVALILCVFLGYLGVHRFYVRKIGSGLLYFFTAGLFGIGWIVDIVRMVSGSFWVERPVNGPVELRSILPSLSHYIPKTASPLRGWTNLGIYEIHGVNPKTGRSNKRMHECLSEAAAKEWALADGLVEPITVVEVPRDMATEKQIEVCRKLGLDAGLDFSKLTKVDVNALIWRHDDGDSRCISDEEWCAACDAGYIVSALCGPTHFQYIMETGDWRYRED